MKNYIIIFSKSVVDSLTEETKVKCIMTQVHNATTFISYVKRGLIISMEKFFPDKNAYISMF